MPDTTTVPSTVLKGVSKTFPGVKALDNVSLTIRSGEVLALVGENGAGKSTLMKVLSGVYNFGSYEGVIEVEDREVRFGSPADAEESGIAIIHQELASFSHLTVAENIFVGHWPRTKRGRVDWNSLNTQAARWLEAVGATCLPGDVMGDLSVGQQQVVEIAKALSRNSKFLILDEPTSALTPREVEKLFSLIRKLKAEGKGLVYISHKMDELYEIADRFTVLRDGKSVHTAPKSELPERDLIAHMVGRSLNHLFPTRPDRSLGNVTLKVTDFIGHREDGKKVFGPISLEARKGEILGFAGLLGAGRSEFARAIFGDPSLRSSGSVELLSKSVKLKRPVEGLRSGLAFVAEDRKRESILPMRSLDENAGISRLMARGVARILRRTTERAGTDVSLKKLATRCTGPEQEIQNLSGGNQQKVILARALQMNPDILILDEPTRGVDVGAKYEIYEILFQLAKEGKTLLVISSELPELMALSDRIVVLHEGRQMGILEPKDFSQVNIMKLAVGKVG